MEIVLVSLVGMLAFGGLFLLLCPEWWSTSLGTLKEEKPPEKTMDSGGNAQGSKTNA
ncbi:hypothetical protein CYFUS_006494 [Cystobacter fuscus]|uniref:Uncharacterized protein n=1 Tax=Cystobacter fuscus TaxID=43 RepID=A0A250JC28_9BACT|nr:hypothetical protein [Cystobacter fuscus]ATB41032.1 hypothetical protein CYFUS_006494 [Cystobacter fuscus]